jgi:hypothetical protein
VGGSVVVDRHRTVHGGAPPIGVMGKLLFVKTYRAGGIIGLVFCVDLIVTGVWAALSGEYAGILAIPAGLFLGKFCWKLVTLKHELYEEGFVSKSGFGGASDRYEELKSISCGATRTNGVLITNIHFVTQSGAKATISMESIGREDKMGQLLNYA